MTKRDPGDVTFCLRDQRIDPYLSAILAEENRQLRYTIDRLEGRPPAEAVKTPTEDGNEVKVIVSTPDVEHVKDTPSRLAFGKPSGSSLPEPFEVTRLALLKDLTRVRSEVTAMDEQIVTLRNTGPPKEKMQGADRHALWLEMDDVEWEIGILRNRNATLREMSTRYQQANDEDKARLMGFRKKLKAMLDQETEEERASTRMQAREGVALVREYVDTLIVNHHFDGTLPEVDLAIPTSSTRLRAGSHLPRKLGRPKKEGKKEI